MPLYRYDSYNRRGIKATGTIDAASEAAAKELLRGQGLMPIKISEVVEGGATNFFVVLFEKPIDSRTMINFTKQLGVLLRSAVPLLQALEMMIEQFEGKFKRMLIAIKDGVKSGESFAKELAKHPRVFSPVYIQLVRAGEASGKLEPILDRLVVLLEKSEETRGKIKKAMQQPIMMLVVALLVVVGMLTLMVPKLSGMFTQMGKELPGPTQFLVDLSNLLVNHFMLCSVTLVASIICFLYWKQTEKGKYQWDSLLLRMPLTSYFTRINAVVQFSKTLGMLLESGVNLSEALDIVCNIVENKVLVVQLERARDNIIKEGKIARYLSETGMFPKIALYMISTGEQSGKLGQMLLTVGNDYEVELGELTDGLTAKIDPIMKIVMGMIVGFIVVSIFLPILSMGDMVNQ